MFRRPILITTGHRFACECITEWRFLPERRRGTPVSMILHFVDNSPTVRRQGLRRNPLPLLISVHTSAKETLAYR